MQALIISNEIMRNQVLCLIFTIFLRKMEDAEMRERFLKFYQKQYKKQDQEISP